MRSARLAVILGALVGGGAVGACGLEAGGLPIDGGDLPDTSSGDAMSADSGVDVPMLPDAPSDIATPDLGTGETESGTPCTCTPPVPNGWAVVTYDGTARPACAAGYDTPANTVENIQGGAATCSCKCTSAPSQNPVCAGAVTFKLAFDKNNSCGGSPQGNISAGVACTNGSWQFNGGGMDLDWLAVSAQPPTPAGGTCANPSSSVNVPAATSDQGRKCTLQGTAAACGQGLCVPTPSTMGDAICVAKAGIQACPMGFPNTHFVGDSIGDNRGCGPDLCACALAKGTCTAPALSLYDKQNCNANDRLINAQAADGVCRNPNLGGSKTFQSVQYTSQSQGASCGFSGNFNPTGTTFPVNVQTICCL